MTESIFESAVQLTMESEVAKLSYGQDLKKTVQIDAERLLQRAPSDSSLSVHISRDGNGFKVALALMSAGLAFVFDETARSPFVASEKALGLAWDKVRVWSASKQP